LEVTQKPGIQVQKY